MVRLLEHLGHEVVFPTAQTCCGQPLYNNGFHDEARKLARRMINVFETCDCVVSPSGSCVSTIRHHYPQLFQDDPATLKSAERLAGRTFEFVEFLLRELRLDPAELGARLNGRVTFHYSCHYRSIGLPPNEITDFIQRIEGIEYVSMPRMDQCCGFGGTFSLNYPPISGNMARDKIRFIEETGVDTVICNDTGCTMNLSGTAHREKKPWRFVNLAELLAESVGLMERDEPVETPSCSASNACRID